MRRLAFLVALAVVACSSARKLTDTSGDNPPVIYPPGGGGDASPDALGVGDGGGGPTCGESPTIIANVTPTRVIYVATDGSDGNDGFTRATAWRSLVNTSKLQPGDRVDVYAGTYPCGVTLSVKGDATHPVFIHSADGPLKAVFECSGDPVGFDIVHASYVALDGLEIRGAQANNVRIESGQAPYSDLSDHVLIASSFLHTSGQVALSVTQATNVDVFSSEISDTASSGPVADSAGIDFVGIANGRIYGNLVHAIQNDVAIQVRGGSSSIRVTANRVFDSQDAFHLGGTSQPQDFVPSDAPYEASQILAHSNVVWGTVSVPFAALGCQDCLVVNSSVAITASTQLVRALPGRAGPNAKVTTSHTANLQIVNLAFTFDTKAPLKLIEMASAEGSGFDQSHNLWFSPLGGIGGYATDVTPGGPVLLLDKDPHFKDTASGDLTIPSDSPAHGVGTPVPAVLWDPNGNCRTVWNIGAY
jgi:hypothetical protein